MKNLTIIRKDNGFGYDKTTRKLIGRQYGITKLRNQPLHTLSIEKAYEYRKQITILDDCKMTISRIKKYNKLKKPSK